jgi:hypothetical protein
LRAVLERLCDALGLMVRFPAASPSKESLRMKYRFARSSRVVLVALLPACGGGDFTATSGSGGSHAGPDAAIDGSSSGGTTGDGGRPGSGGSGGGGNSSGGAGSGGRQTGDGGPGGNQGTGGNGGGSNQDAGAGGAADGGSSAGGTTNTGGTASGGINGAGGGCSNPITWYVDADQDGYGSTSAPTVKSCSQPQGHYTKVGGDCDDTKRDVHPQLDAQEKKFFGTPYRTADGADSYDYDCSGVETGDPGQQKASTCAPLMIGGTCGGTGYSPGMRGAGLNAYCGSQKFQTCKLVTVSCSTTTANVTTPYGCN